MTHRVFLLVITMLALAGCYRQAEDNFQQVDSQSIQSIASPTAIVPIQATAETTQEVDAQTGNATAVTGSGTLPSKTPDPADVDPTDIPVDEPTVVVPSTNIPAVVPTATNPVFLTPEPPPGQVVQPTIIPPTATPTFDIIPPTPTDIADEIQAGDECIHEVIGGDNLFRIAINNGTTVEAIQQLNSLEDDAIQVGQLLRIPGCVPGQSQEPDQDSETVTLQPTLTRQAGGSSVATLESPNNLPASGQQIHVVRSGETLGGIANRYNTTISEIVEINDLANPDSLSVGQELVIPASN